MDRLVVYADFGQRAVAPEEIVRPTVLLRLGKLLDVAGKIHLLRSQMSAKRFVHGSTFQLHQRPPHQRVRERHFVAVVRERFRILQNPVGHLAGERFVEGLSFQ